MNAAPCTYRTEKEVINSFLLIFVVTTIVPKKYCNIMCVHYGFLTVFSLEHNFLEPSLLPRLRFIFGLPLGSPKIELLT